MNIGLQILKSGQMPCEFKEISLEKSVGYVFQSSELKLKDQPIALFGGWEWRNEKVNSQFLSEAEAWARDRGCTSLIGPYDTSTYLSYRLRLDHFEKTPFSGEPNNQIHDVQLLTEKKFAIIQKYETFHFSKLQHLLDQSKGQSHQLLTALNGKGLEITTVSPDEISRDLPSFFALSHEIFKENFLYHRISFDLFKSYFENFLLPAACWDTTVVLKEKSSGRLLGYSLNFKESHFPKKLFIKSAGVHPQFRHMGLSFMALSLKTLELAQNLYEEAALCLMKEGNFPSLLTQNWNAEKQSYGLFGKNLI